MHEINTDDLLSSPEMMLGESVLNLSPNTISQELAGQSCKEFDADYPMVLMPAQQYQFIPSHLHQLPILDTMDGDYNFSVSLNSESASKTSWMFSNKLNKVFVKISTHLNVYANFTVGDHHPTLFLRAMIVYTSPNDLAEPVKKCPNHRDQSTRDQLDHPEHILRCAIPETHYMGFETGKLFKDKLALLIPMSAIASNEGIKLQFTCQNSCSGGMNRKMTTIVFTLENDMEQILGRQVMNFKVCSCPKRDKDKDEESVMKSLPKKRKAEQTAPSTSKKVAISVPIVKQESEDSMSDLMNSLPSDLTQAFNSPQQGCEVVINMPSHELKQQLLHQAYNLVAGTMTRGGDAANYQRYLVEIQKQIGK